jgi:stage II sporulation protein AA (anti-sigma F factor antagonist)
MHPVRRIWMKRGIHGRSGLEDRTFAIQTESSEAVERVRVLGEVDLSVVDELDTEMRRAESTQASRIELDLDQLAFLDASGIRLLLDLTRRSLANDRRLRIRPASSPQVRRVLELTGVAPLLPLES